MDRLPDDALVEILMDLDPDSLEAFCGSSKRLKRICRDRAYSELTKDAILPYKEMDPYKRYLITVAIYGSSMRSAALVHPDYACIQAVKFDNEAVFERYYPFTTNRGKVYISTTAGKFARSKYFKEKRLTNDTLIHWFAQTVTDPAAFEASLREARLINFQYHDISLYNETIRTNIINYGSKYFTPALIESLKDNTFDPTHTIDPDYPYKHIKNTAVKVMAWNLWHIPIDDISEDILQQGAETIGHLSALSLPIIYLRKSEVFFQNNSLSRQGYLPFLRFINRFELPPRYNTVNNATELSVALRNPLLIQAYKTSEIVYGSYDTTDKVFIDPYYEHKVTRPNNYYILNGSFGIIIQQAALSTWALNRSFIYGEDARVDDTPLGHYKDGKPYAHVYSQALAYDNYIAAAQNINMNNGTEHGLIREILRKAGPILLPGTNSNPPPGFEGILIGDQLSSAARFMIGTGKYTTSYPSGKFQVDDTDLKILVARRYIEDSNYNRAFKVGIPNPTMLIHQIAGSFDYIRKDEMEKILGLLSQTDIEKLIPAAISLTMLLTRNELSLFYDWLRASGKDYSVNTDYLIKYYDSICLYGLSFMARTCNLQSLCNSLLAVLESTLVPQRIKLVIQEYLRNIF